MSIEVIEFSTLHLAVVSNAQVAYGWPLIDE